MEQMPQAEPENRRGLPFSGVLRCPGKKTIVFRSDLGYVTPHELPEHTIRELMP
jgi:hypothetical protein